MNQTTKETRRRSYDAVLPKRAARCRLILETLGNRELTARPTPTHHSPASRRTSTALTASASADSIASAN